VHHTPTFDYYLENGFSNGFFFDSVYMSPFREKTLLPTGVQAEGSFAATYKF
jgi:hypothetical protein